MASERADRLAALQVPELRRLVKRSRDGMAAVGRHRHGADRVRSSESPNRWLRAHPNCAFSFHSNPRSWLNQIEIWLAS
jgi:hypothetical protein